MDRDYQFLAIVAAIVSGGHRVSPKEAVATAKEICEEARRVWPSEDGEDS